MATSIPQTEHRNRIEISLEDVSPAAILAASHLLYQTSERVFAGQRIAGYRVTPFTVEAETEAASLLNQIASALQDQAVKA